jgi:hypothetical protein
VLSNICPSLIETIILDRKIRQQFCSVAVNIVNQQFLSTAAVAMLTFLTFLSTNVDV